MGLTFAASPMTRVPIAPIPIAEPATIKFTIQEAMGCNLHHEWGNPLVVQHFQCEQIGSSTHQWAQPQPEPHPPPERGAGAGAAEPDDAPTEANTDKSRTAFSWPCGHVAGSLASAIGRRTSKVVSQVLQRKSYSGMSPSVGVCLTYVMASNDPMTAHPAGSTILDTRLDEDTQTGEPTVAHIVKVDPGESAQAKVMEARIYGSPLEALCGHVWVPSRDPKKLPMCEDCKSIYEMYRMMNDGLNEQPSD